MIIIIVSFFSCTHTFQFTCLPSKKIIQLRGSLKKATWDAGLLDFELLSENELSRVGLSNFVASDFIGSPKFSKLLSEFPKRLPNGNSDEGLGNNFIIPRIGFTKFFFFNIE